MIQLATKILRKIQHIYEAEGAPWIARNACWIYWPFYKLLRHFQICFVVNIAGGTGHIICELDLFLRKLKQGEIDPRKKYVWIRKPDIYSHTCIQIYGNQFWLARCSYLLYNLTLPLTARFLDITLDCGLSRLKWQLTTKKKYFKPLPKQTYMHQLSKQTGIDSWCSYYQLRQKDFSDFPLLNGCFPNTIFSFIEDPSSKIAVVHIKEGKINATALPTDPATYLQALNYLVELEYRLIFVGREKMPKEFLCLPIYNYSESQFANFNNDILLFRRADLAIVGGSGISFLADCYGKPYLYLNSWHLPMAMFSSKCKIIPTLVQHKSGKYLTFAEQMKLYSSLEDKGAEIFPEDRYIARNATSDEIYEGIKELLLDASSPLQQEYKNLCPGFPLFYSKAQCSAYFLEKHASLFAKE